MAGKGGLLGRWKSVARVRRNRPRGSCTPQRVPKRVIAAARVISCTGGDGRPVRVLVQAASSDAVSPQYRARALALQSPRQDAARNRRHSASCIAIRA